MTREDLNTHILFEEPKSFIITDLKKIILRTLKRYGFRPFQGA